MALTAEQRNNANIIIRVGQQQGASRKQILSALTAAMTEANLQNPHVATDHDSIGAFQIRPSMHPGVNAGDVAASAKWFYQQVKGVNQNQPVGAMSQAVERSAYPGRYAPNVGTAQQLFNSSGAPQGAAPSASGLRTVLQQRVQTLTLPGQQITPTPQDTPVVSTPNIQGPQPNLLQLPTPPPQQQPDQTFKFTQLVPKQVLAQGGQAQPGTPAPRPGLISPVPAGVRIQWNRSDQGIDMQLPPGTPLRAVADGRIEIKSDPHGFGAQYLVLHTAHGDFYYGHAVPGQGGGNVRQGQIVAKTSRTGQNAPPGWLEFGTAPGGVPAPFGTGAKIRGWVTKLPQV